MYKNELFENMRGIHGNNTGLKSFFDKQVLTTSGNGTVTHSCPIPC